MEIPPGTHAMWVAGTGTDGFGTYFDISLSIDTTGYTGSESDLAHGVEFKNVIALGALIVMLLFRPQGLLGQREWVG